jgi:2-methylcitrate dehydratase PrpD
VNGTAAHAFQLDEVHAGATLHPGSVVVPAALALASGTLSGREFLAAVVAGYETGIRIGLAAEGGMFRRGYHNQGTTGCVAAAAAAARALELDAERTAMAMSLGASQAAGLMAVQEGANAKAFHSGRAAQSGVYAALLAKEGFSGAADVLDAGYGRFFDTLVGEFNADKLVVGLGDRWETLAVGYKLSPASNGSITAMDTLSRIMSTHRLGARDIDRIVARVSTNTLHHCAWEFEPAKVKGVLGAQMNLRYGLAVMALDRVATPAQYTPQRIREADVAALLPKIEVHACDEFDSDSSLRLACRLEVHSRDGKTYADQTLYRKGSAEDPVSVEQLEEKFLTLTVPILGGERARACLEQIRVLDSAPSVADLATL